MALPPNLQKALDAKNAAAGNVPTPAPSAPAPAVADENVRRYQFPSAPSSFIMPDGRRLIAHDGVYSTSNPAEIAELDAAVGCGNLSYYGSMPRTAFQQPVLNEDRIIAGLNGQNAAQ